MTPLDEVFDAFLVESQDVADDAGCLGWGQPGGFADVEEKVTVDHELILP